MAWFCILHNGQKERTMKTLMIITIAAYSVLSATSCKKKESGVCYCSYLSGDKKEFNFQNLPRDVAQDSCNTLDGYATAYAGDCDLK